MSTTYHRPIVGCSNVDYLSHNETKTNRNPHTSQETENEEAHHLHARCRRYSQRNVRLVRRTEADRCRTEADRSGTDLLHAGDRPRVTLVIDDQPKALAPDSRLKMKKLIISMLAAASLFTVASAAGANYPMNAVNGQTCVYMTSGLVCD